MYIYYVIMRKEAIDSVPKAKSPEWRRRKDPVLDHLIVESIQHGYAERIYTGIETRERALEIKRALFRAGGHVPDGQGSKKTSVSAKIEQAGNEYQVRYQTFPKTGGRGYILEKHGSDRTKWPYSPFKHDPNFDSTVIEGD
jgi:hypothetical protein